MKRIKFVHVLVVVITGWFFLTTWCLPTAAANKANNNQPARSFTVKAVIPHNQIDKKLTYYDLQVYPQQKQTLKMVVTNLGTKKLKVDLNINNAYTSQNGIISYDKSYVHLYKAQQPALSDLVQGKRHKS
ncbi:MAG: WxL protein peptidoglycan domain-containing protein, partial [Bombilactobacillus sp.]